MGRITIGYQDACLAPLWISRLGMRVHCLLGADAIWVPDHFMGFAPKWMWKRETIQAARIVRSMDALFDPVPLLTIAAMKHRRVWIGTSVTEPIRRHPMSLAQTFVTLDHVSGGRAVLGIGSGIRENTEPYGFSFEKPVSRLAEALEIIGLLWGSEGKPITYDGSFWQLRDAVFDLPLYGGKSPRIFIGAHFPRMLRLCGRYADGWLPGQKVTGDEYGARLEIIRGAADAAGRSMTGFTPGQTLLVAFGESRDAVMEKAIGNPYVAYMACGQPATVWNELGLEHPIAPDFGGFIEIVPSRVSPEQIDTALARLRPELVEKSFYMGTVNDIVEQAAPLVGAGCRHFVFANMGSLFTGEGVKDFARAARLFRALKRL